MQQLTALAPAKVNLYLHITGKRLDGYHLLESMVVFVDIGDDICVAPAEYDDINLTINGEFAENLPVKNNLILKAAKILRDTFHIKNGANITLTKNLPLSSGIGGGSSDAATVAKLLCKLWNIKISRTELAELLLPLGADLPMCVHNQPLIASGIGEVIAPIALPKLQMVLVNPFVSISSAEIYQMGIEPKTENQPPTNHHPNFNELILSLTKTSNHLSDNAIAFAPEIAEVLKTLQAQNDCLITRMSGSGATCFATFPDSQSAKKAQKQISSDCPNWWVKQAATITS